MHPFNLNKISYSQSYQFYSVNFYFICQFNLYLKWLNHIHLYPDKGLLFVLIHKIYQFSM